MQELKEQFRQLKSKVDELAVKLRLKDKQAQILILEQEASEESFWDNLKQAQHKMQQLNRFKEDVTLLNQIKQNLIFY